ncbi:hypothetical protein JAAARDRAFT_64772 [Jaapia argillacea MUCL 33604]|uniref:Cytochrome c oxidase assembly protein COX15 n=1 Tax=Jaapia argillacea MUCL 33604 TaxID=933084 RepID=A0A067QD53_9AGAM|nr:hypothetical protein JAAARDRAFT_64772 [Jaapia argillacea MUCL 33604]
MLASAFARAGLGSLKYQTSLCSRALFSKTFKPSGSPFSTCARAQWPALLKLSNALGVSPRSFHRAKPSSIKPTVVPLTERLHATRPRFFFSNAVQPSGGAASPVLPVLSPASVGHWLKGCGALVFAVIVVGGVTRLTESGLSITEWHPIAGCLPPSSEEAWDVEFDKYKATPEFKILNQSITMDEFKSIFYMEWSHRVLGRLIGVAFIVPAAYFAIRKKLTASLPKKLLGMALLIAAQGVIGWYMVKSGLEDSIIEVNAVPRVSQYRLALHLGTAFVLYGGLMGTGLAALSDWNWAHGGLWSKVVDGRSPRDVIRNPLVRKFKKFTWAMTALIFLTAISGAFAAGLDAGMMYDEFPYMGGRLVPPKDELLDRAYAKKSDCSDLWWRNILENPTMTQFNHRWLAVSTYIATGALCATTLLPSYRAVLPPLTKHFAHVAFGVANIQLALGISTLLYFVPVSLAACHQAGSVALFTLMVHILTSLRRPGQAARTWRQAWAMASKKSH